MFVNAESVAPVVPVRRKLIAEVELVSVSGAAALVSVAVPGESGSPGLSVPLAATVTAPEIVPVPPSVPPLDAVVGAARVPGESMNSPPLFTDVAPVMVLTPVSVSAPEPVFVIPPLACPGVRVTAPSVAAVVGAPPTSVTAGAVV